MPIIRENHKEVYKGYEVTVKYTEKSKLVGDRFYTAIAKKNGRVVYETQNSFSFEGAVNQVKTFIDFKLSVEPMPTKKLGGNNNE